jgi:hypothetical protein
MAIRHCKSINKKSQTLIEFGIFILLQVQDEYI